MNSLVLRCYFLLTFLVYSNSAFAVTLKLGVGQQEALSFDSLAKSVKVDPSGVIDVAKGDTKSIVLLTGKAEGFAEVTVRLEDGKTVVYQVSVSRSAKGSLSSLLSRLRQAPGISLEQQGAKWVVSGQFRNRNDQLVLQNGLRTYPGLIVDATDPDIVESNSVVKAINRVLQDNDIGNLQAHAYGQIIALEGSPKNEMQKTLALRIARMISPGIEDHVSTDSNGAPSIAIEVLFIEASKTNNKSYGIKGPQDAFAGVTSTESGLAKATMDGFSAQRIIGRKTATWQVGTLSAFLKLQQVKGSSRIVSNPKLITRSGQKAEFESGGAFYIEQQSRDTSGTTTKTYTERNTGITLSVEPKIDAIGQIDSKIKTTIVDTKARRSPDSPPDLIKSNLETVVTIPSGQSILLSGLTLRKASKSVKRVPLLADIPIVGELFKEREQDMEEKEVAVIVTMKRVAPSENRAQVADQLLDTSDNDVSFSFFD